MRIRTRTANAHVAHICIPSRKQPRGYIDCHNWIYNRPKCRRRCLKLYNLCVHDPIELKFEHMFYMINSLLYTWAKSCTLIIKRNTWAKKFNYWFLWAVGVASKLLKIYYLPMLYKLLHVKFCISSFSNNRDLCVHTNRKTEKQADRQQNMT